MTQEGNILTPSDGAWLTNGSVWSGKVYLGTLDKAENWREATQAEYDAWLAGQETQAEEPATE